MSAETICSMDDCTLPVGYHSLFMTHNSSNDLASDCAVDFSRFQHNFLVQNYALILPTHLAVYDICHEDTSGANLNAPMSVVSLRPAALDAQHRNSVLSVCDHAAVVRSGNNLGAAVDQSYQALWTEVFSLESSLGNMKEKLESCASNIQAFRETSMKRADFVREDLVSYLAHSLKVEQAIQLRQFKAKRLLSDTQRLQDLYVYLRDCTSRDETLLAWKQICQMRDATAAEIDDLMAEPPLHPYTMALTNTNKRLVALRREVSLRNGLIEKLAHCLRQRGALNPQDEELISGF